ncbi:low temperature requirement protein A (plasmid) [Ensifer adhaerens]|uniref:low temperature requirement protein A n=1 Tax=Ensifer adhaerens TaxID=106592 RepID=UPI0023A9AC0C|nr:low temperature requirement protein A [Ensifer adhaerens]WDZ79175.1 low temperature requirement protein A [Ensifer adhaerens]
MPAISAFSLPPRDRHEVNRSSTSLELMFDLATVVAVAAAAHGLAWDIEAGEFVNGIVQFACSFFMAWLAWANYTWFASGYDNKSAAFRVLTMVIMFGSLTLAGGIRSGLGDEPHWLVLIGFSIMRLGMIALWLGAANGDRHARPTALRYAAGIGGMQIYWNTLIIALPPDAPLYFPLFALGAAGELAVPLLAERGTASNWHHGHIIDRYNSFNIIVLGECFAAIALIISDPATPELRHFWWATLCSIIAFSMWGLYFDRNEQLWGRELSTVLTWAYGHCVLFAAGAATAAGFIVYLAAAGDEAVSQQLAALAFCVPIAMYLTALWLVRDRASKHGSLHWLLLVVAALALASSAFASHALELMAMLLAITVAIRRRLYPAGLREGGEHD